MTTTDRRPNYSIIIPAYNEGARIGASLQKVLTYVAEQAWVAEILVVNDGSNDDTPEIVRSYAMLQAQGAILLFSDADLSSPIEEAGKLLAAITDGADIAMGSRWLRSDLQTQRQPLYRQLFGRIFNLLLRITLGLNFKDTQCGFKAFTRRAAKTIFPLQRIERWGFDPEVLYLARKFGFKVAEVPVAWAHREGTRINPLSDGTKMFVEMVKIRWNGLSGKYVTSGIQQD